MWNLNDNNRFFDQQRQRFNTDIKKNLDYNAIWLHYNVFLFRLT